MTLTLLLDGLETDIMSVCHDSRLNSAFRSYCYLGLNHLLVQLDVYNIHRKNVSANSYVN